MFTKISHHNISHAQKNISHSSVTYDSLNLLPWHFTRYQIYVSQLLKKKHHSAFLHIKYIIVLIYKVFNFYNVVSAWNIHKTHENESHDSPHKLIIYNSTPNPSNNSPYTSSNNSPYTSQKKKLTIGPLKTSPYDSQKSCIFTRACYHAVSHLWHQKNI